MKRLRGGVISQLETVFGKVVPPELFTPFEERERLYTRRHTFWAFIGQVLGVSFACGLNLYLTVAALGLLSRLGVGQPLPPGAPISRCASL